MRLKSSRLFIVLALGAALVAGLYLVFRGALRPADEQSPAVPAASSAPAAVPAPSVKEFRVERGQRVAGPSVLQVRQGDIVTLRITSDEADEVHVHGYDLHAALRAGVPAVLSFRADRSGRFDVELHHKDLQLATLEVQPL